MHVLPGDEAGQPSVVSDPQTPRYGSEIFIIRSRRRLDSRSHWYPDHLVKIINARGLRRESMLFS